MIGWYNPFNATNDSVVNIERMNYWLGQGAQLTPNAEALIARIAPDTMKEIRAKAHATRTKRAAKRRAGKKASAAEKPINAEAALAKAPRKTVKKATPKQ
jgi:ribosomal protein S16